MKKLFVAVLMMFVASVVFSQSRSKIDELVEKNKINLTEKSKSSIPQSNSCGISVRVKGVVNTHLPCQVFASVNISNGDSAGFMGLNFQGFYSTGGYIWADQTMSLNNMNSQTYHDESVSRGRDRLNIVTQSVGYNRKIDNDSYLVSMNYLKYDRKATVWKHKINAWSSSGSVDFVNDVVYENKKSEFLVKDRNSESITLEYNADPDVSVQLVAFKIVGNVDSVKVMPENYSSFLYSDYGESVLQIWGNSDPFSDLKSVKIYGQNLDVASVTTANTLTAWVYDKNLGWYWPRPIKLTEATPKKNATINKASFNLSQNYPNPFNPTTKISYSVPKDGFVDITIYNIQGAEVKKLVDNQWRKAGNYSLNFDGENMASGTYFYKLKIGEAILTRKMVLVK